jgi:hypothetical protein
MYTPYAAPVGMLLYIQKTLNGKFKISLVIKFRLQPLSLTSSMSSSKHKGDPGVPMK